MLERRRQELRWSLRIYSERQSAVLERQHLVKGFAETGSSQFGLSTGRGENSIVTEYSAFLILQLLPLVADSGSLSLRTIRIHEIGGVSTDVNL